MTATDSTKHQKSKALKPGSRRPAKELCSECGLCDTYYIHYVKESCAFLTQHIAELEAEIHGRSRNLDNADDWYFGVSQNMMAARNKSRSRALSGRESSAQLRLKCWKKEL